MKQSVYSIIYNDEDIIIVNKAAGVLVAADRWDEKAERLDKMLSEELFGKNSLENKLFAVHRIDKDTSGLIMYALHAKSHKVLNGQFQNRSIEKIYHAVILGSPVQSEFVCSAKLKVDGDKIHRTVTDEKHGKDSHTEFKVLQKFGMFTLLQAKPISGRTHQIRVHLKHLGFPILCDPLYGSGDPVFLSNIKRSWHGNKYEERPLLNRLALHAYALKFVHPIKGNIIEVTAEYPKDFRSLLNQLKNLA